MSLTHYATAAGFNVPSEGPDGSDGCAPCMANTLEEAKADIRRAYREFHDAAVDRIEVLPFGKGRSLLVVYELDADEVSPQLLVFQPVESVEEISDLARDS